jgi:hypothetical protein
VTETTYDSPPSADDKSTVDQAKEKAQDTMHQVQDKAVEAKGQLTGRLRQELDGRSTKAGAELHLVLDAVRRAGQQLREEGQEGPAKLVEAATERLERLGNYLSDADADRMLRDVEDFGRRQPWLVAGGGMLLGLFGSRLLKASSSRRYELSDQEPNGRRWYGTRSIEPAVGSSYANPALTVGAPTPVELLPTSDRSTGPALPDATPTAFPASPSTTTGKTGGSGTSGENRGH